MPIDGRLWCIIHPGLVIRTFAKAAIGEATNPALFGGQCAKFAAAVAV
jgi:hypothetical protein